MISIGKIDCDLESADKRQKKGTVPTEVLRSDVGIARRHVVADFRNDARMNQVLRSNTKIERPAVTSTAAKSIGPICPLRASRVGISFERSLLAPVSGPSHEPYIASARSLVRFFRRWLLPFITSR